MTTIKYFIDLFLHIDKNLVMVIAKFGGWSYGILFLVIFSETGLVITPFLPGDSLLFAAGALAARGSFDIVLLYFMLLCGVLLGDNVNYWVGRYIGPRAFSGKIKLLRKEYLDKTQAFYDKHGGKAVVLARFVPIVRTFAPFVAGVGKMKYIKFLGFSITGACLWVTLFLWGGFYLGNIPVIKHNFELVVVLVILISVVPIGIGWWKAKKRR